MVGKKSGERPSSRVVLEQRARRRTLEWRLRLRALDRRPRRAPDFIVAGAQKAGSTSLFAYLAAHPDVTQALVKEVHYFDLRANRGHRWYRRHFPLQAGAVGLTGEASPMYMVHPLAMERIAAELPQVKIVVVLREPLARLLSHYRHSVRLGHESLDLTEALDAEEARLAPDYDRLTRDPFHVAGALQRHSYLTRSLYADQVRNIQRLFGERSFFLRLEDLTTVDSLRPLCEFLGLRFDPGVPFEVHNVNTAVTMPTEDLVGAAVLDRLRRDGAETCDLLGWEPWRL